MKNFKFARHKWLLWTMAVFITLFTVVYQRRTGPTYPQKGSIDFKGLQMDFKLTRSETTDKNAKISILVPNQEISGQIRFRRLNAEDSWTVKTMLRKEDYLTAELPAQPAAGKLQYFVELTADSQILSITGENPVIIRFRGNVPLSALILHIIFIFTAMLLSTRTGLESFDPDGRSAMYLKWTIAFLFIGGFIFGPIMQQYAFGALWTGFPFGHDLTDNKTLIAMLGWLFAWYKNRKGPQGRGWILAASILLLAMYLIPHSLLGSELNYNAME